jgi:uncharacterized Zn finger protein (UPF0148 family)
MSDDFDKEAERQRLREKYERDKEDRESTERMSELLLQGATMTNRHCDTCGSPIFRYQGQEFCPNCQMETESTQQAQDGDGAVAESGGTESVQQARQPPNQQPRSTDEQPSPQDAQPGAANRHHGPSDAQPGSQGAQSGSQGAQPGQANAQSGAADTAGSIPEHGAPPVDDDSLEAIRSSLTQTLARFSQLAASTDDPHRAREYLETAKRAAETLRTLPR